VAIYAAPPSRASGSSTRTVRASIAAIVPPCGATTRAIHRSCHAARGSDPSTASPAHVIAIAWQAQQRLHRVWRRLDAERAKRRTIVAVAVARELAGFCWAIARAD